LKWQGSRKREKASGRISGHDSIQSFDFLRTYLSCKPQVHGTYGRHSKGYGDSKGSHQPDNERDEAGKEEAWAREGLTQTYWTKWFVRRENPSSIFASR
jgi:hypothetical protein